MTLFLYQAFTLLILTISVTSLEFSTLNQGRLNAILEAYMNTGQILSIPEGNIKEKLRFSFR